MDMEPYKNASITPYSLFQKLASKDESSARPWLEIDSLQGSPGY